MNRVTLASIAFLLFAVGLSAWLLTRPRVPVDAELSGVAGESDSRAGLTFAEWSVKNDGVLLADIDPGARGAASTLPRKFVYLPVVRDRSGAIEVSAGRPFSWAPADQKASSEALFALGFRVNVDGRAFTPPDNPLWSDPIPHTDGGTEETVVLKTKGAGGGGSSARFQRRRGDPHSAPYWSRRAIGFPSSDGHMVYVTPDAIVISTDPR